MDKKKKGTDLREPRKTNKRFKAMMKPHLKKEGREKTILTTAAMKQLERA